MKMLFNSICLGMILFYSLAQAQGAKDTGNGGDAYTIEFVSIGKNILEHWEELDFTHDSPVTKEEFERTLTAEVHSTTEKLYVNHFEVDAKNYPFCTGDEELTALYYGVILINRTRWDDLRNDIVKKVALVFHEYLGVIGKNKVRFDDYYQVSASKFEKLKTLFGSQTRANLNFVCLLQGWNDEKKKVDILQVLETTDGKNEAWFEYQKQDYVLQIRGGFEDLFSKTLERSLYYSPYTKQRGNVPNYNHPLSSGAVDFKGSKKSLRIWNQPEFQLVCYRTFEGMDSTTH